MKIKMFSIGSSIVVDSPACKSYALALRAGLEATKKSFTFVIQKDTLELLLLI